MSVLHMCFCVRELLAFVLRMLEKQQHINKPLASVSHSQVKLALNGTAHGSIQLDLYTIWCFICWSRIHCFFISVGLHRLPDWGKTKLHHLGAWKCVRNTEETNPRIGTISRMRNCSKRNDYTSGFVLAERIRSRTKPLSHWIHCHESWGAEPP